jgi:hypothetical protein
MVGPTSRITLGQHWQTNVGPTSNHTLGQHSPNACMLSGNVVFVMYLQVYMLFITIFASVKIHKLFKLLEGFTINEPVKAS